MHPFTLLGVEGFDAYARCSTEKTSRCNFGQKIRHMIDDRSVLRSCV